MDTESGNPCGTFEVVLAMYLRVVDAAMAVTDAAVEVISVFDCIVVNTVELVPVSRFEVVDLVADAEEAVLVFGVKNINLLVKDGPVPNPGKIDVAQDV